VGGPKNAIYLITLLIVHFHRVPAFSASKFMITNREFSVFVKAGGYNKREMWTEEGWHWKQFCQATHPIFWVCDDGLYIWETHHIL
jgi:formylglycine-generating enzyme required for sulfatase activity